MICWVVDAHRNPTLASIWSGYTSPRPGAPPRPAAQRTAKKSQQISSTANASPIVSRPAKRNQILMMRRQSYRGTPRPSQHRAELLEALRGSAQHASRPRRAVSRAAQEPGQGNGTTSFTGVATKGTLTVVTTKGTVTVQHDKRHGATNCGDEPLGQ